MFQSSHIEVTNPSPLTLDDDSCQDNLAETSKPRRKKRFPKRAVMRNEVVNCNNRLRALHGSPPLIHNNQLRIISQRWASAMAYNHVFYHSWPKFPNGTEIGENIYLYKGGQFRKERVCRAWYNKEIPFYDFDNPGYSIDTGHFTQMIWKSTKYIGVGSAVGTLKGLRALFVVATYYPAGNSPNQFRVNVLEPRETAKTAT